MIVGRHRRWLLKCKRYRSINRKLPIFLREKEMKFLEKFNLEFLNGNHTKIPVKSDQNQYLIDGIQLEATSSQDDHNHYSNIVEFSDVNQNLSLQQYDPVSIFLCALYMNIMQNNMQTSDQIF